MVIHQIEKKVTSSWNAEVKAVIDTWTDYSITLDQFKELILDKIVPFAEAQQGQAVIVDSTDAVGTFLPEIQEFIEDRVFQAFQEAGIKFFITTSSKVSPVTNANIESFVAKAGPSKIQTIMLNSTEDAIKWLKKNGTHKPKWRQLFR